MTGEPQLVFIAYFASAVPDLPHAAARGGHCSRRAGGDHAGPHHRNHAPGGRSATARGSATDAAAAGASPATDTEDPPPEQRSEEQVPEQPPQEPPPAQAPEQPTPEQRPEERAPGQPPSAPVTNLEGGTFEPPLRLRVDEEKKRPYKVKWDIESPSITVGVANDGTFLSNTAIQFSDLLGDQRVQLLVETVSQYSNILANYVNLKKRVSTGAPQFSTSGTTSSP